MSENCSGFLFVKVCVGGVPDAQGKLNWGVSSSALLFSAHCGGKNLSKAGNKALPAQWVLEGS